MNDISSMANIAGVQGTVVHVGQPTLDGTAYLAHSHPDDYAALERHAEGHPEDAQPLSEEDLARIHGPVGFDLGAAPEEITLGILAEIVATHNGKSGRPKA